MQPKHPLKPRRVGRPSKYGEPTVKLRIPVSKVAEVEQFVRKATRKLPLIVVGKPGEKHRQ